ncbi:unnamed protein product, partial [Amoebophrya sp. A120]
TSRKTPRSDRRARKRGAPRGLGLPRSGICFASKVATLLADSRDGSAACALAGRGFSDFSPFPFPHLFHGFEFRSQSRLFFLKKHENRRGRIQESRKSSVLSLDSSKQSHILYNIKESVTRHTEKGAPK